jgi:hypothetical protein
MGKKRKEEKIIILRKELKENEHPNIEFYTNKRPSYPEGDYLKIIHKKWFGKRKLLEENHSYIQWLFPTTEEPTNNTHAYPLSEYEINYMTKDADIQENIIKSYELMLDFYGMRIKNKETGELERNDEYQVNYNHLNKKTSAHNFMRICRIIKSMNLLGLSEYTSQLIVFLVDEIYVNKVFKNLKDSYLSMEKFFLPCIKNEGLFQKLNQIIKNEKNKNNSL